jgi:hypothetical protein
MNMSAGLGLTHYAGLGDGRFTPPLSTTDDFNDIHMVSGTLDFRSLVDQATASAGRSVDTIGHNGMSKPQRVWELLSSRKYRRGPTEFLDSARTAVLENVGFSIETGSQIELCVSFFPCKLRQPLKTFARLGSEIDLGELATVLRLYEICTAIEMITDRPTVFRVLCDGSRYKSCFFDKDNAIRGYVNNIKLLIDHLGISRNIDLLDEGQLFTDDVQDQISNRYFEIFKDYMFKESDEVRRIVNNLLPKIILNMDIDPQLCEIGQMREFYCKLFSDPGSNASASIRLNGSNCFQQILQTCISSACRFLAINQTLGAANLTRQVFANSIRCTVHPKPGQIGIHPVNKSTSIFAHCGQGVLPTYFDGAVDLKQIRVDFRANLMRRPSRLKGIVLDADEFPFASPHHPFIVTEGTLQ